MADFTFAKVPIRYDGLDAEAHELDLFALGESLQGAARIISVVGNFVVTGKYAKQFQAHEVRVVAAEAKSGCFEIQTLVQWAKDVQIFSGAAGPTIAVIITYVLMKASGSREEMKHLAQLLEIAIKELGHKDQGSIDRLIQTIENMADALKPAVKQAITPVGSTCETMRIGGENAQVVDRALKDAIMSEGNLEVLGERAYEVLITELDLETHSCKVHVKGESAEEEGEGAPRRSAQITDPALVIADNPYVIAMSHKRYLAPQQNLWVTRGSGRAPRP